MSSKLLVDMEPGKQKASSMYVAIFLCGCMPFLILYSTQSLLPQLSASFNLTPTMVSWTISATTLAMAMVAPFVALITGSFEHRRMIAAAALLLALPTFTAAHTSHFGWLIAMRFGQGIFIPVIFAVTITLIGEQPRKDKVTKLTSLYVAGTAVGGFLSRFLTALIASISDWRLTFEVLAALVAIISGAIFMLLPVSKSTFVVSRKSFIRTTLQLLTQRAPLSAFAIGTCLLFAQVAAFTYIGFRLTALPFAIDTVTLGSIYSVFLLAALVVPIAGHFAGERQHKHLLVSAMVIGSIGIVLTLTDTLSWIVLGLALASIGIFLGQTAANAFIANVVPEAKTLAVGLYLAFYYLGGSLGAVVPGPLWRSAGWSGCAMLIITAQMTAILLALYYWQKDAYQDVESRQPQAKAFQHTCLSRDKF